MAVMPITSTSSFYQFALLKSNPLIFSPRIKFKCFCNYPATRNAGINGIRRIREWVLRNHNERAVETSTPSSSVISTASTSSSPASLDSASTAVRKFYQGFNAHDLVSVEKLIAENCIYEDLIFPQPFVGRKAILEFFNKLIDSISTDLQFVIDDISENDASGVGVTWHLEWKGKHFPFSKGCSFYRLEVVNDRRQICYVRDSVEPAIKPGESALVVSRGVTWLLQQFPQLAERL